MVCGLGPRKPKVEVLKLEWDHLQNDNARLRSERDSSRAEASRLKDDLMQIRTRISSFIDEYRVNTPLSGGDELDAVFDAYSKLARRHVGLEDLKRRVDENLQAQKEKSQGLEYTLQRRESEFEEQTRKMEGISERELSLKEKEIRDLEKKLIMGGDYFQPKPDSELTQQFNSLQAKVRIFAEETVPADQGGQQAFAEDLERKFKQSISISHLKHFSEEAVWAILIDKVFSTPFRVFGKHGDNLVQYWLNFFPEGQIEGGSATTWPPPNSFSERWRSLTVGNLAAAVRGQRNGREAREIQSSYNSHRNDVVEALRQAHLLASTGEMGDMPEKITDLACEIAMTCGAERYRIQPVIPQKSTLISKEDLSVRRMEVRNIASSGNKVQVTVGVVISPGLEKGGVGDGNAQSFDGSYRSLFPAHVYTFS